MVSDVTRSNQVERERRVVVSQLVDLIDGLQGGILVEDESRRIVHANEQLCALLGIGVQREALIGVDGGSCAERVNGLFAEPERFVDRIAELLSGQRAVRSEQLRLVDGRTFERDYIPIFVGDEFAATCGTIAMSLSAGCWRSGCSARPSTTP